MRMYAERPGRRVRQFVGDLAVIGLVLLFVIGGWAVHDAVRALEAPGRQVEQAGQDFTGAVDRFGTQLERVPLVGEDLRESLGGVRDAGGEIEAAGRREQEVVRDVARVAGLAVAVPPTLLVVLAGLLLRLRWAREAAAARQLREAGPAGLRVLALRAVTRRRLSRLPGGVAGAVAALDGGDNTALAAVELHALGLHDTTRQS